MNDAIETKHGGIADVLSDIGYVWSEDAPGIYVVKRTDHLVLAMFIDEFPQIYSLHAMVLIPEDIPDRKQFAENVKSIVNHCGYPQLDADFVGGNCWLNIAFKYRGRRITGRGFEKNLSFFMKAYQFFFMNMMLIYDMDTNPQEYNLED